MNNINTRGSVKVRELVYLAILTAVVFVLQLISFFMRFTAFSLTFVLVPIVIGVALSGKRAGAWLGFIFGVAVLATGDAALFLSWDALGTIILVLLKGTLAGFLAGLVYDIFSKKNRYLGVILAAVTAPTVNTLVFILGSLLFFYDDIAVLAGGAEVFPFILTAFVGINYFIELGVNVILSPTILRIINIKKKA